MLLLVEFVLGVGRCALGRIWQQTSNLASRGWTVLTRHAPTYIADHSSLPHQHGRLTHSLMFRCGQFWRGYGSRMTPSSIIDCKATRSAGIDPSRATRSAGRADRSPAK
ncbi:hypothetical protein F751_3099 [Auxenochlorella protothecoides]|uniref:Secreted protein n=1 Tax=Auxenochlorella protothecoides TaxID=3075 RepID=A0A087SF77_AUXPR|nr:hypothetical protein F751_3099 [Auxenochlorella protothecoides]KFM24381.1 hypothetical protein F751_3099 [Auxenochlorella protothecoides]